MTKIETILATVKMTDLLKVYDIEEVNGRYRCPFHNDNKPSAVVNRDNKTFHCYPCNFTCNVIGFVKKFHKCSTTVAIAKINDLFNLGLNRHLATAEKHEMLLKMREGREERHLEKLQATTVSQALKMVSQQLRATEDVQIPLEYKIKCGNGTNADIDKWFANEPTHSWLVWLWNKLMGYEQDRSPFDFDLWKVADLNTVDLATVIVQHKLPLSLSHYKPFGRTK